MSDRAAEEGAATAPSPSPSPSPNERAAAELARLVSYVVLLAGAAALYFVATSLPTSRWEPLGAGAFPRMVMILLGVLCLLAIADSFRKLRALGAPEELGHLARDFVVSHRLVIFVFIAFGVYLAVLRGLGFAIATFLFLLVAQLIVAPRSMRSVVVAVCVASVFSFGLNYLFAEVFRVFLPRGLLG
ncbi:tripartite tricarboxylate transporter TctB family protein [Lutibaculum baratangense]|uniref:DUF1468 domain-containing protein n=1 Tax=Lutibaculum baratangense AMV1 TaxID=631454 RepID=V4TGQ3_9HYPH|nr:tripartite tricarboxylate transporter TctB family protein [Lutibaculum baratangense]ESR25273.1 hypothetical protein N177_1790 [Lutibaculum baratangense AMV1]